MRLLEDRLALGTPIHAIEHQTVQVDIQIGGRAQPLDEGNGTSVGVAVLYTRLLSQEASG